MQAAVIVRCGGKGFLLVETHPTIVERRFPMAARVVMKILRSVRFCTYILSRLAKAASLPKHMVVTLATNILIHVIHALSHDLDTVDKPRFDKSTHANGEWVEKKGNSTNTNGDL